MRTFKFFFGLALAVGLFLFFAKFLVFAFIAALLFTGIAKVAAKVRYHLQYNHRYAEHFEHLPWERENFGYTNSRDFAYRTYDRRGTDRIIEVY